MRRTTAFYVLVSCTIILLHGSSCEHIIGRQTRDIPRINEQTYQKTIPDETRTIYENERDSDYNRFTVRYKLDTRYNDRDGLVRKDPFTRNRDAREQLKQWNSRHILARRHYNPSWVDGHATSGRDRTTGPPRRDQQLARESKAVDRFETKSNHVRARNTAHFEGKTYWVSEYSGRISRRLDQKPACESKRLRDIQHSDIRRSRRSRSRRDVVIDANKLDRLVNRRGVQRDRIRDNELHTTNRREYTTNGRSDDRLRHTQAVKENRMEYTRRDITRDSREIQGINLPQVSLERGGYERRVVKTEKVTAVDFDSTRLDRRNGDSNRLRDSRIDNRLGHRRNFKTSTPSHSRHDSITQERYAVSINGVRETRFGMTRDDRRNFQSTRVFGSRRDATQYVRGDIQTNRGRDSKLDITRGDRRDRETSRGSQSDRVTVQYTRRNEQISRIRGTRFDVNEEHRRSVNSNRVVGRRTDSTRFNRRDFSSNRAHDYRLGMTPDNNSELENSRMLRSRRDLPKNKVAKRRHETLRDERQVFQRQVLPESGFYTARNDRDVLLTNRQRNRRLGASRYHTRSVESNRVQDTSTDKTRQNRCAFQRQLLRDAERDSNFQDRHDHQGHRVRNIRLENARHDKRGVEINRGHISRFATTRNDKRTLQTSHARDSILDNRSRRQPERMRDSLPSLIPLSVNREDRRVIQPGQKRDLKITSTTVDRRDEQTTHIHFSERERRDRQGRPTRQIKQSPLGSCHVLKNCQLERITHMVPEYQRRVRTDYVSNARFETSRNVRVDRRADRESKVVYKITRRQELYSRSNRYSKSHMDADNHKQRSNSGFYSSIQRSDKDRELNMSSINNALVVTESSLKSPPYRIEDYYDVGKSILFGIAAVLSVHAAKSA